MKIVKGDKVKCIKSTTTGPMIHPSDEIFTVTQVKKVGRHDALYLAEWPNSGYVYAHEFEKIALTIEELELELVKLNDEYESKTQAIEQKIAWMKATGNAEYNDTEAKVWHVLQELKTMTDEVSKAKAIAKIIDN